MSIFDSYVRLDTLLEVAHRFFVITGDAGLSGTIPTEIGGFADMRKLKDRRMVCL